MSVTIIARTVEQAGVHVLEVYMFQSLLHKLVLLKFGGQMTLQSSESFNTSCLWEIPRGIPASSVSETPLPDEVAAAILQGVGFSPLLLSDITQDDRYVLRLVLDNPIKYLLLAAK